MMFSILEGSEVNQLLTVIQYKSGLGFAYLDVKCLPGAHVWEQRVLSW